MYLEDAWCEISNAVNYLKKFVEILLSTRDQEQLQLLSESALKHISDAEKHCKDCKDDMEQNRSKFLIRIQKLKIDIHMKESTLLHTTSLIQMKEADIFSWDRLAKEEAFRHIYNEQKYVALQKQWTKQNCDLVGINIMTAVCGLGITIMTAGITDPLLLGLQSGVMIGSSIALVKAVKNLNLAKNEYTKSYYKLYEYRREKTILKDDCIKLQQKYDLCRQEQRIFKDKHTHLLERLSKTTSCSECLFNCRHFISILRGRIEVLQESRKNIAFQHDLRLPLEEIHKLLTSVSSLDLMSNSETRNFCQHLSGQLMLQPTLPSTFDKDDYSI